MGFGQLRASTKGFEYDELLPTEGGHKGAQRKLYALKLSHFFIQFIIISKFQLNAQIHVMCSRLRQKPMGYMRLSFEAKESTEVSGSDPARDPEPKVG